MLVVKCVVVSAFDWLENRLKVCIYDKRSLIGVAELPKFDVGLLTVRSRKHVQHRHKVLAGAEFLVAFESTLKSEVSETAGTNILTVFMFCYITDKTGKVGDGSVMLIPVEQICFSIVIFFTVEQQAPTFALVIGKRIDICFNLKSVFVKMYVLRCNGVWKIGELIAFKHFIRVK